MSEITGFNPVKAKEDIKNFYREMINIENNFYVGAYYLFNNLRDLWCSEKAIEFYDNNAQKTIDIDNEFINDINSITSRAIDAYNLIAKSNNALAFPDTYITSSLDSVDYDATDCLPQLLSEDPTGIVGMNIKAVKEELNDYVSSMNDVVASLDEVPTNVAFYDPDGSLQEAYESLINKMKSEIPMRIDGVKNDINSAIETEVNTIDLAKTHAAEIMRG